jgi:hypothetical protein
MDIVLKSNIRMRRNLIGLLFVFGLLAAPSSLLAQADSSPPPPPTTMDGPGDMWAPAEVQAWPGADGGHVTMQAQRRSAFAGGIIGAIVSCFLILLVLGMWITTFLFALLAWREAKACRRQLESMAPPPAQS